MFLCIKILFLNPSRVMLQPKLFVKSFVTISSPLATQMPQGRRLGEAVPCYVMHALGSSACYWLYGANCCAFSVMAFDIGF